MKFLDFMITPSMLIVACILNVLTFSGLATLSFATHKIMTGSSRTLGAIFFVFLHGVFIIIVLVKVCAIEKSGESIMKERCRDIRKDKKVGFRKGPRFLFTQSAFDRDFVGVI